MSATPTILYRNMMREARKMNDYNFRMFALRRVKTGFVLNRTLQGEAAVAALTEGHEQLNMLKRQVVLGQMYPSGRSVMD